MKTAARVALVGLLVLTAAVAAATIFQPWRLAASTHAPAPTWVAETPFTSPTPSPTPAPTPSPTPAPTPTPEPTPLTPQAALDAAAGRAIPILMYHAVADTPLTSLTELFVKPSTLAKQLQYLNDNGYQTLTFEDLIDIDRYDKPILLTFDDGYRDNYTELLPLLEQYNAKATVFVIPSNFRHKNFCTEAQIREMADSGHISIQSHTKTHRGLANVTGEKTLASELGESKTIIEALTNRPVVVLAYPNGESNQTVQQTAAQYYDYALNKDGGLYIAGQDRYTMNRIRINRSTSLEQFAALIAG